MTRNRNKKPARDRVLVVEDEPLSRLLLTGIIEKMGCQVHAAGSGKEALLAIAAFRPDLVLLDIIMEEPDGYEICRRLKTDPEFNSIPIIFISSLSDAQDEAMGLAMGAVDYIHKPFAKTIVQARTRTHLELKRHRDHLEELVVERTRELHEAEKRIKVLKGLLPICASCKQIRDREGRWNRIEVYIEKHSEAEFTHGICPACAHRNHPEIYGEKQ